MITVTGGAGFIGSHIVDDLLSQGEEVTVIDNFSEGTMDNLRLRERHPKLRICRVDIRDYHDVENAMRGSWAVFHLAAMSRIQPSITDPLLAWHQNLIGTGNVLEAARKLGVKRVVYSASSSAYGQKNVPPLVEDMSTDCLNPYSLSKKVGEEMMELYSRLYGLSTVSLRYFNVYGPRHQESGAYATVIAIFRRQKRLGQKLTVVGDGEQRRDFTFVGDVVRANMLALMNSDATGVINIGTGENYSINQVAAIIGGDKEHVDPRLGEARLTLANRAKASRVLGWEPQVSLQQGLEILDRYEQKFPPGGIVVVSGVK